MKIQKKYNKIKHNKTETRANREIREWIMVVQCHLSQNVFRLFRSSGTCDMRSSATAQNEKHHQKVFLFHCFADWNAWIFIVRFIYFIFRSFFDGFIASQFCCEDRKKKNLTNKSISWKVVKLIQRNSREFRASVRHYFRSLISFYRACISR